MSKVPIIEVRGLGKKYRVRSRQLYLTLRDRLSLVFTKPWKALNAPRSETFWALRDINFEVEEGEVIGIIGRNGAGKSTLLKILSRITEPTEGQAILRGRVGSLLEVGTGFHPELTGRENIFFVGILLGMSRSEIRRKFDDIVSFSGVEEFLDTPLKHYSSGMAMRLAFAVAAHLEPEILIVDEVLAVGDIDFQRKCLSKMEDISKNAGRTVLFVSHQIGQIRKLCSRTIWLDGGHIRMIGSALDVTTAYERTMTGQTDVSHHLSRQAGAFGKWRIANNSAEEPHTLRTFGPVEVEFDLMISKPMRLIFHGISLISMDGKVLWSTYMRIPSLAPGKYQLSYTFDMLPLPTGQYYWHISLYDESGLVDVCDCLPYMEVYLPDYQHPDEYWKGVMNLPHTKTIKNIAVPV
ncbi:MAG: ABC transporter ATP-binding protein [Bacteroidia bacterium]|nr:ABC transporter ATP-binding protein [Bacteroidia bacterium]